LLKGGRKKKKEKKKKKKKEKKDETRKVSFYPEKLPKTPCGGAMK
jgi:hypothetical protein